MSGRREQVAAWARSPRGRRALVRTGVAAVPLAAAGAAFVVHTEREALKAGKVAPELLEAAADESGWAVTPDGVRLYWERWHGQPVATGRGPEGNPTIVLIHGYTLDTHTWALAVPDLVRAGFDVLAYDQRGHGLSTGGAWDSYSFVQMGQDLAFVLDECTTGEVVLVGHSMGGFTILELARQAPEVVAERVAGAAFVATSAGALPTGPMGLGKFVVNYCRTGLTAGTAVFAQMKRRPTSVLQGDSKPSRRSIWVGPVGRALVQPGSFGGPVPLPVLDLASRMIMGTPPRTLLAVLPQFRDYDALEVVERFAEKQTLVLNGTKDVLTPPRHSRALADRLPATRHVVVQGAGHLVMLEHPDLLSAELVALASRTGEPTCASVDDVDGADASADDHHAAADSSCATIVVEPRERVVKGDPARTSYQVRASDGTPLHVEITDAAPSDGPAITVVLSHGYVLDRRSWDLLVPELASRGFRVVRWDQRGHGRSGHGEWDSYTIDQTGLDLAAVIETFATGGDVVLVGHSMGAMSMMALADARPDIIAERVAGAAFLSTTASDLLWRLDGAPGAMARVAAAAHRARPASFSTLADVPWPRQALADPAYRWLTRRRAFGPGASREGVRRAADMVREMRPSVMAALGPQIARIDKEHALAAYADVPCLIVNGTADVITAKHHSHRLADALPHARHVELDDAGHLIMLDRAEQVNAAVLDLVQQVAGAAAPEPPTQRTGASVDRVSQLMTDAARRAPGGGAPDEPAQGPTGVGA